MRQSAMTLATIRDRCEKLNEEIIELEYKQNMSKNCKEYDQYTRQIIECENDREELHKQAENVKLFKRTAQDYWEKKQLWKTESFRDYKERRMNGKNVLGD